MKNKVESNVELARKFIDYLDSDQDNAMLTKVFEDTSKEYNSGSYLSRLTHKRDADLSLTMKMLKAPLSTFGRREVLFNFIFGKDSTWNIQSANTLLLWHLYRHIAATEKTVNPLNKEAFFNVLSKLRQELAVIQKAPEKAVLETDIFLAASKACDPTQKVFRCVINQEAEVAAVQFMDPMGTEHKLAVSKSLLKRLADHYTDKNKHDNLKESELKFELLKALSDYQEKFSSSVRTSFDTVPHNPPAFCIQCGEKGTSITFHNALGAITPVDVTPYPGLSDWLAKVTSKEALNLPLLELCLLKLKDNLVKKVKVDTLFSSIKHYAISIEHDLSKTLAIKKQEGALFLTKEDSLLKLYQFKNGSFKEFDFKVNSPAKNILAKWSEVKYNLENIQKEKEAFKTFSSHVFREIEGMHLKDKESTSKEEESDLVTFKNPIYKRLKPKGPVQKLKLEEKTLSRLNDSLLGKLGQRPPKKDEQKEEGKVNLNRFSFLKAHLDTRILNHKPEISTLSSPTL